MEKLQNNDQIWTEVKDNLEEKFFVVALQLKDIRLNEKRIVDTQENHARILNNAISVIESSSRSWMACSEYFCARDQKLKLQIKLASSLLALNNEIKSYRIATYAYRLTILNAVMTMVEKLIPMTLLSKNVLEKILDKIASQQVKSTYRLTLAIPPAQILTYYETKLFTSVSVEEYGMLFRLAIPFASASTALNLYRAITIPMPTNDSDG